MNTVHRVLTWLVRVVQVMTPYHGVVAFPLIDPASQRTAHPIMPPPAAAKG